MSRRSLRVLLTVNVLLLAALAVVSFSSGPVSAQLGMRGDYVMIAGAVTGRSDQDAVYIFDLKSQKVAALLFDTRKNRLQPIAGRVVSNDLRAGVDR